MSTDRKFEITDAKGGAAFTVKVVTRAVDTEIVGQQEDGSLKVRLKASPAGDPAANKELIEFVAKILEVDVSKVEIVAGEGGRDKLISVEGISTNDIETKFGGMGE